MFRNLRSTAGAVATTCLSRAFSLKSPGECGTMTEQDADLFLDWAAAAFLAAGRADHADQRRLHRQRAEFYCDIFHTLSEIPVPPEPEARALIGSLLENAFAETEETEETKA